MQRILIIGSGGAGKSTLARTLAERLGLPLVHLDQHHWHAGWVGTPEAEWRAKVAALVAEPQWVMDGNFGGTLDVRLAACDTVVFLDLPRWRCLARTLRRWWTYRGRTRPDMAPGCVERPTLEYLHWVLTFPEAGRKRIVARLAALPAGVTLHRLRSPREVQEFVDGLAVPVYSGA